MTYTAKVAVTYTAELARDKDALTKIKATKEIIEGAGKTIKIGDDIIEVDEDTDIMELYRRARKEADYMVKTGDTKVYEQQLNQNKEFIQLLKEMEETQSSKTAKPQ